MASVPAEFPARRTARTASAGRSHKHDHTVQFYANDSYLTKAVTDHLAQGLRAGSSAVVIATPEHRETFAKELADQGLDSHALTRSGRLRLLDADETLQQFMVESRPDESRFREVVGGVIASAAGSGGKHAPVRAFGEMVDLLWRQSNHEGAVALEDLWNRLAEQQQFSLLCGYRIGSFYKEAHSRDFEEICHLHSAVIPVESYSALTEEETQHREVAFLQQRAAALEAEIEHRKELESALRNALATRRRTEEALREASRTKDEFLATLSHELRTPLTAILGWARMLTIGGLDPDTEQTAISTIERSAKVQAMLVDDLLDLSRIITGKLTLQSELVDLSTVASAAVQTLQLAAEAKQIQLRVEGTGTRTLVVGDAGRLQQVLWNLLSNAIKFSERGSTVTLDIERTGEHAQIVVRDNGRGIEPDFLPHIFEPFRQEDSSSTRSHVGMGLGLAIVKYLVELHGGTISASSPGRGQGVTMLVRLPLASPRRDQEPVGTANELADLSGCSVLLVDDDSDGRTLVAVILRRCGADVFAVGSVREAVEVLNTRKPHIVVTDLGMPERDGFALLEHIRSIGDGHIPVVALTALSQPDTEKRIRAAGFDAFARKPVDPTQFARLVGGVRPR